MGEKEQQPAQPEKRRHGEAFSREHKGMGTGKDIGTIIWRENESIPEVHTYLTPAEEKKVGEDHGEEKEHPEESKEDR
jgi:hypothetical protein